MAAGVPDSDLDELAALQRGLAAARADRASRPVEQVGTQPAPPPPPTAPAPARNGRPAPPPPRTNGGVPKVSPPPITGSGRAAAVIAFALAQVGKRYVWNTAGPSTYDCSGLMMASFARAGIYMAHQSESQGSMGRYVPRSQWLPGTLLHWPGHVALYLGGGRMVHAANPRKGVLVSSVYGSPTGRWLF